MLSGYIQRHSESAGQPRVKQLGRGAELNRQPAVQDQLAAADLLRSHRWAGQSGNQRQRRDREVSYSKPCPLSRRLLRCPENDIGPAGSHLALATFGPRQEGQHACCVARRQRLLPQRQPSR